MQSKLGVVLAFVGGVLFACSLGATKSEVVDSVKTRSLSVVDDEGRNRISMGVTSSGTGIYVYDENHRMRLGITLMPDGAQAFSIFDAAGQKIAALGTDEKGTPSVKLEGRGPHKAAAVMAASDSVSYLNFEFDGTRRLTMGATELLSTLSLKDARAKDRISFAHVEDGDTSTLHFLDSRHHAHIGLTADNRRAEMGVYGPGEMKHYSQVIP